MKPSKLFSAFIMLVVIGCADAATYLNTERLSGQSFLNAFSWMAIPDPTEGRVDYVNQSTAQSSGLYSVSGDTVTLRADNKPFSIPVDRAESRSDCNRIIGTTNTVAIFDISHIPEGCGTWPAVCKSLRSPASTRVLKYSLGYGEIDIVEGINNRVPNQSTLHTNAGMYFTHDQISFRQTKGNDCNVYTTNNRGCGVLISDRNSFGPNFNNNGGGWSVLSFLFVDWVSNSTRYAVERSKTYVAIYFWGRNDSSVPVEVKSPRGSVDTSTWGTPAAHFPDTNCYFTSHLGPMHIIINLTFCGIWAGNVYSSCGCPSTCIDYVNNIPWEFTNAYFEFNSLNIYQ
ncbi:glycoside hydrolase family 16 protein [Chiua virens]|nr:glycoside hydrolase family 16 protein [Chiua virens]